MMHRRFCLSGGTRAALVADWLIRKYGRHLGCASGAEASRDNKGMRASRRHAWADARREQRNVNSSGSAPARH